MCVCVIAMPGVLSSDSVKRDEDHGDHCGANETFGMQSQCVM